MSWLVFLNPNYIGLAMSDFACKLTLVRRSFGWSRQCKGWCSLHRRPYRGSHTHCRNGRHLPPISLCICKWPTISSAKQKRIKHCSNRPRHNQSANHSGRRGAICYKEKTQTVKQRSAGCRHVSQHWRNVLLVATAHSGTHLRPDLVHQPKSGLLRGEQEWGRTNVA